MFTTIVIFSLFVAVTSGSGQFSVLLSPSSIAFSGNSQLESAYVGDVLLATLGNAVIGTVFWPSMSIQDPFSLAKTSLIIIKVQGVHQMPTPLGTINYGLVGSDAEDSLNYMINQMPNGTVHDIDFGDYKHGLAAFASTFGNTSVPMVQPLQYLNPYLYWSHRHFLEALGLINHASQNLDKLLMPSHALIFRLPLDRIVRVTQFAPINEAKNLLAATVENLLNVVMKRNESVLLVQIATKTEFSNPSRSSFEVMSSIAPFEKISLDQQFPVISNIMVWFFLAFAIAVAVISYSLFTMDPGRDSVIFRVSTHKDLARKKL